VISTILHPRRYKENALSLQYLLSSSHSSLISSQHKYNLQSTTNNHTSLHFFISSYKTQISKNGFIHHLHRLSRYHRSPDHGPTHCSSRWLQLRSIPHPRSSYCPACLLRSRIRRLPTSRINHQPKANLHHLRQPNSRYQWSASCVHFSAQDTQCSA
jgi:hypothetical protein